MQSFWLFGILLLEIPLFSLCCSLLSSEVDFLGIMEETQSSGIIVAILSFWPVKNHIRASEGVGVPV